MGALATHAFALVGINVLYSGLPFILLDELVALLPASLYGAVFLMEMFQEGFEILRRAFVKEVFARATEQQQLFHTGCSGEQDIEGAPKRIPVCVHDAHISDDAATKRFSL